MSAVAATTALTELNLAVRRGAVLLDERGPADWRALVDVAALSAQSTYVCVVGQVFTPRFGQHDAWEDGLIALGVPSYDDDVDGHRDWIAAHGFDIPSDSPYHRYDDLTAAWRRYLSDSPDSIEEVG